MDIKHHRTVYIDDAIILKSGAVVKNASGTTLLDENGLGTFDAVVYKGVIDCSSNPNYPAASAGELYLVSVAGKIGGASGVTVEAGDMLICKTDGTAAAAEAAVGSSWNIIQTNLNPALYATLASPTFTGQVTNPAGTVGAPGAAVGTTNKGMYEVSANQLGVAVAGSLATMFDTEGVKTDSVQLRASYGTTPVGTVSYKEYGDSRNITTVLTLTDFIVGVPGEAAAALGFGNIVYAFPAGAHLEEGSYMNIALKAAGTAVAADVGLGSVVASGVISLLDGTGTFEDRLTGQTITTDPAGGTAVAAIGIPGTSIGTGISANASGDVKNVFLNAAGTWNVDNTGNLTASGTITLKWTMLS